MANTRSILTVGTGAVTRRGHTQREDEELANRRAGAAAIRDRIDAVAADRAIARDTEASVEDRLAALARLAGG